MRTLARPVVLVLECCVLVAFFALFVCAVHLFPGSSFPEAVCHLFLGHLAFCHLFLGHLSSPTSRATSPS